MFSTNPNYTKLKTHLRLAINRLKLLEKKKTELAQKARKEIAEYIASGKSERAKIRVEHIIREDYMVEAMEIVEMYCDLILARFGLVTQMKEVDEGLSEALASLIWVAPRMHTDVQELKVISDLLTAKYGKIYADACRNESTNMSEKLKHKLSVQSPPKILVEKYLIEIAKNYNVEYVPDEQVMREAEEGRDALLIDINSPPNPPGFIGYPPAAMPGLPPPPPVQPFNYPNIPSGGKVGGFIATPPSRPPYGGPSQPPYSLPPGVDSKNLSNSFLQEEMSNLPPAYDSIHHDLPSPGPAPHSTPYQPPAPTSYPSLPPGPTPQPRARLPNTHFPELPDLPSVPSDLLLPSVPHSHNSNTNNDANATSPGNASAPDEIDFEDLNRRFEELKKKK